MASFHSDVQAYTVCAGGKCSVYFESEIVRVDIPHEIQLKSASNILIV